MKTFKQFYYSLSEGVKKPAKKTIFSDHPTYQIDQELIDKINRRVFNGRAIHDKNDILGQYYMAIYLLNDPNTHTIYRERIPRLRQIIKDSHKDYNNYNNSLL